VRTAAHLIADSGATKDDLVHLYGANPERITVAYLGVDPSLRPVTDPDLLAAVQKRYAIRGPYVLYVGTVQPRKNLSRLIAAFAASCREPGFPEELQLVLAGKRGWLYEDILSRARELDIGDRVHFTGYVDPTDLAALYSGATLFSLPSLYEGFCMPVLEAMACHVPVVCSRVSSLPEVVGDAALTVDPHDVDALAQAIVRAVSDPALREDLVARGVEQVTKFTWRACAETVLQVLERSA
jgi:glycosyltransferase involved in cell wall biosynthesis